MLGFLLCSLPGPQEEWTNEANNLNALNQWVDIPHHFKMECLTFFWDLLKQGEGGPEGCLPHGTKHPDHQRYLHFTIEAVNYQFSCWPFALACAPWAFTKLMKAVVTLLRSWWTSIIIYRQHPDHVRACSTGNTANSHSTVLGFHQHQEISDGSNSGNRIAGHDGEYPIPCWSIFQQIN